MAPPVLAYPIALVKTCLLDKKDNVQEPLGTRHERDGDQVEEVIDDEEAVLLG